MALSWEYERKYGKHRVNPTSFLPNNHDADVAKFSKKTCIEIILESQLDKNVATQK